MRNNANIVCNLTTLITNEQTETEQLSFQNFAKWPANEIDKQKNKINTVTVYYAYC